MWKELAESTESCRVLPTSYNLPSTLQPRFSPYKLRRLQRRQQVNHEGRYSVKWLGLSKLLDGCIQEGAVRIKTVGGDMWNTKGDSRK